MAAPKARRYKAGSIIYFEGDKSNGEVYVLQSGRVILTGTSLDQQEETKENVRQGEFFGVKSAIGHYPREETAQVVADSLILVFDVKSFEALCLKNPRIVLQMLKVFSSQLRKVHKEVRRVLGEVGQAESSVELLKVAEYYYKSGNQDHALYAYEAYLKYYANTPLAARAKKMIENLQKGKPYPLDMPSLDEELQTLSQKTESPPPELLQSTGSVPDIPDLDDFSDPMDSSDGSAGDNSVSSLYYAGVTAFSQGNYEEALAKFTEVTNQHQFSGPEEAKFYENAFYEMGRCYLKLGQENKAMETFSQFIKRFPRNDYYKKALIAIAEIFEKKKNTAQAVQIYKKVAATPPKDSDSAKASSKLKRLSA
ncbi:MAG: cAMP-binding protein [Candidatus Hydrogenedentota bacterium]|nr:MAG: cAMP-binding protein [Candidatus Hydrogenedentota bacterium]